MSELFPDLVPLPPWHDLAQKIEAIPRPVGGFSLLLADNPWAIAMRSAKGYGKSPQAHYQCVPTPVLAALPVWKLMSPNSIALIWGTWAMLEEQMALIKSWGFTYKSAAPWFKGSPLSEGDDCEDEDWNPAFAGGYLFRSCSEILLIATRGEPKLLPARRKLRAAFFNPQRENSRKPDEQYTHAEALSPGPYLELFSRTNRAGWVHFGDEAGKFGEAAP